MKLALFLFACLALNACAGANLAKFTEQSSLPEELTAEARDQFIAREIPAPVPSPSLPSAGGAGSQVKTGGAAQGKGAKTISSAAGRAKTKVPEKQKLLTEVFPRRRPLVDPFWLGEKQSFDVAFLGVVVGYCDLEVMPPKVISNRKAYHVKGKAHSTDMFGVFYRVNDWMETYFDFDSLVSHKYRLVLDESKQSRDLQEFNDPVKLKTFYWNRLDAVGRGYQETKVFADVPALAQDSLSQLYYVRTLPLKDGEEYKFNTISEGKVLDTTVKVLGREKFKSPMGEVTAIKLLPEAHYHGILKKAGDSYLWVTDDDRRVILKFEARVKIGTVTATLKGFTPGSGPIPADPVATAQTGGVDKPLYYR